ncbi:TetR/AcrR family transcriptional regulator [Kerstersia gyiorum]|uniref:TetR/AcrR family transcriptional regulator n=1 Tax=Kerstersia gyiorum TaxID=206506 RepID=UPI0039E7C2E8
MSNIVDRPYHHGDLKRALIDTAMAMLHEDKNWQFTLREVARRAQVSHAAPYKHFADKAALLKEVSLIGFDQLRAALARATDAGEASLRAAIFAMAQGYICFATTNPGLYRLMFSADAGSGTEIHLSERALSTLGILVDLLERGQADGQLRPGDVRAQVAACWAMVHGLALLSMDGLLLPEKVGPHALEGALTVLFDGLGNV